MASWRRIFNRNAEHGIYAVFFKVFPLQYEDMYDNKRQNNSEYLQMAIVDNHHRSVIPGNPVGTGMIIGRDSEDLCDKKDRSTHITDILNRRTSGKTSGLYPSHDYPSKRRAVVMQGVYEVKEIPMTEIRIDDLGNDTIEETNPGEDNHPNGETNREVDSKPDKDERKQPPQYPSEEDRKQSPQRDKN